MTKSQYLKLKKIIDKLENQYLDEGGDITSPEFDSFVKEQIESRGFTLEEYKEHDEPKPPEKEEPKPLKIEGVSQIKGVEGDVGPEGKQGLQGLTGAQGATGKDSKVVGPRGPVGKEGKSIKGEKGDTVVGPPGPSGKDGKTIIEIDKKALKKLEKKMVVRMDKLALSGGGGRSDTRGSRFFNWGMPDKGSYGTAIPDTRYYKKEDVQSLFNRDPENLSSQCDGSTTAFSTTYSIIGIFYVSLSGTIFTQGLEFTKTGDKEITLTIAPDTGEELYIKYAY